MAIISFWSDGKSETGKTGSIAAIATYMAINYTYKTLIFDTECNNNILKDCFWEQEKKETESKFNFARPTSKTDLDTGTTGLVKAILSNKTSPEIITNYTRTIFKSRLEILTSEQTLLEDYKKQRTTFNQIAKLADKYYNLVLIDVSNKEYDNETKKILEASNIIIINLPQNMRKINEYLEFRKHENVIDNNKVIILFSKSDENSKYNAKNIGRLIGEKDVYSLPYNTQYFEATNEGKVTDYFMKFRGKVYQDKNTQFIEATKEVSDRILEKIKEIQIGK